MRENQTLYFTAPAGWSPRRVAQALAKEWLPPFLAAPDRPRGPRWVLRAVARNQAGQVAEVWEAGISTEEYERRMEDENLIWHVQLQVSNARRGAGHPVAWVRRAGAAPGAIAIELPAEPAPGLPDPEKAAEFLGAPGGMPELTAGLLSRAGFTPRPASPPH